MGQILLQGLGKAYRHYPKRWQRLLEWLWPSGPRRHRLHWVLQGVDLRILPGESVGLMGLNGAGKSTLLKIIAGTVQPTEGQVRHQGHLAALLELGMGFHPEFTGRENAILAGRLLGHSAQTMQDLMPQIEAFAEIGDYMDQALRTYSSGMQVRLAFSVATAVRPDILIVDEALSVGDAYFQQKSFDRIRQFRQAGTTLLLVSHDKQAIQSICERVVLLHQGRIDMDGPAEAVMDRYNALLADHQPQQIRQQRLDDGRVATSSGTGEATVSAIGLFNPSGQAVEVVGVGDEVLLRIEVMARADLPRLVLGYGIKNRWGQVMYGTNTELTRQTLHSVRAGQRWQFELRFPVHLAPGHYSIQTALTSSETHLLNNYEWRTQAWMFTVINAAHPYFEGQVWMPPEIRIAALPDLPESRP